MKDIAGKHISNGKPIVVGVARGEVSGLNAARHAFKVRRHAEGVRYRCAYTVLRSRDHEDPVEYALGMASGLGADALAEAYDSSRGAER